MGPAASSRKRVGLPRQHLVGHALERLAKHHETTVPRVARAEVDVGQLSGAPARTPLHREHDEVEGVHRLDLEPARTPAPRLVRRRGRLRHHPFVTGGKGGRQERGRGLAVGGGQPVDALAGWNHRVECRETLRGGQVEQVGAVEVQQIEEEHRQRLRGAGTLDVGRAPEP